MGVRIPENAAFSQNGRSAQLSKLFIEAITLERRIEVFRVAVALHRQIAQGLVRCGDESELSVFRQHPLALVEDSLQLRIIRGRRPVFAQVTENLDEKLVERAFSCRRRAGGFACGSNSIVAIRCRKLAEAGHRIVGERRGVVRCAGDRPRCQT